MDSTVMTIFNQLTGQYTGSISAIQSGSIVLGKELFNCIALLSVGLLGIRHLLRKNVDMVESNIELIRWLIYLNVFYLFITQYDRFLPLIIDSFKQAGVYLGGQASGSYIMPTPSVFISNGFDIALKILSLGFKHSLLLNIAMALISVIAVIVILYCFGMIAIELVLIDIGSRIILAVGIFLLAFAGLSWTREYAEHYIHTFFHIGMKMLFMYVLIGIGAGLTSNWAQTLSNIQPNLVFQYVFAMVMATFVFYKLCQKLPDQAVVYLSGRFSMNYDPASTVHSAITKTKEGVVGTYKNVKALSAGLEGMTAGIQGMSKAISTASQVGKTNGMGTIKTLGAASKTEWEKKVDETKGGKLAKNILATIPKPKRVTKKSINKNSNENMDDYTI